MKTVIYYFTGTGNSLDISKSLQKLLTGCNLISIPSIVNNNEIIINADCAGIVFPVYWLGPPLIVNRFLDKIKPNPDIYLFCINTFGGFNGQSVWLVNEKLKEKDMSLNAGFSIWMPGNNQTHYKPMPSFLQNIQFKKKDKKIKKIADIIKSRKKNKIKKNIHSPDFLIKSMYGDFIKKCNKMDNNFWVDDSCSRCGICKKICPVNNISITEDSIKWNNRCEFCLACIQWCPNKSIQFNNKTLHRVRYQNPGINIKEMF